MLYDRPALKGEARQAMAAARPHAMLVAFVQLLLTSGLSVLLGLLVTNPLDHMAELLQQGLAPQNAVLVAMNSAGVLGLFLNILVMVFGLVVAFGYRQWALNAARNDGAAMGDLIHGFSMVGSVLWLNVLLLFYQLAWLVVVVTMAEVLLLMVLWVPILNVVAAIFITVFAAAVYLSRVLRYSLAACCLLDDPGAGAFCALRRSCALMRGHVKDFIFLHLSFWGWHLLSFLIGAASAAAMLLPLAGGILSLTISLVGLPLTLWLSPYISISECKFYDLLRSQQAAQDAPPPFEL